jgi:chromosome segregation ATPase
MMDGAITWQALTGLLGLAVTLAGFWRAMTGHITRRLDAADAQAKSLGSKIEDASKELAAYKLTVAEEYAKVGYLRDVETRLLARIGEVANEIHGLRGDIKEAMQMVTAAVTGSGKVRRG